MKYEKSVALPLGKFSHSDLIKDIPFKLTNKGFKYLGLYISPKIDDLVEINLKSVIKKSNCKDLQRWAPLPLSLLGYCHKNVYLAEIVIPNAAFTKLYSRIFFYTSILFNWEISVERLTATNEIGEIAVTS